MVNLCDKKNCWTCDDLCDDLCKMVNMRQCKNRIFIQKMQRKNPFIQDFLHKRVIPGGRSGTRTLGPLIKSQLLYQLS